MLPILILSLRILLVAALFAFLGWAMYTLWSDLRFHSQLLSKRKVPPISVIIDNDPEAGKFTFSQGEILIGRDPSCGIVLQESIISNHHAKLIYRNMHWWIEDLLSTNGTFLNDERVEAPAILINGDELRIGKSILMLEIAASD